MKRTLIALAILALFLIANRGAFEGYFSDDDLDNLSWATVAGADTFARELLSPVFSANNTRPTGALYYRWTGHAFGWNYGQYLIPLFLIHWLNCGMLFWIMRRKGIEESPAVAATLFFLFHSALLEAWWKPMYIFDLLAATFCLITWLIFGTRYWWVAIATFWLAYKSKEVALFFPVVLALDNWKRAIPFLAISASFGLQAMRVNAQRDTVYTLRFSPRSLLVTVPFYLKYALLNKYGAVLIAPLLWFGRERDFWKAVAGMCALMIPLVFLPGRLFSVYLYVPMLALVPGLGQLFTSVPKKWLGAGLILFLAIDYQVLREKRRSELAMGHEARAYVQQLIAANKASRLPSIAYLENAPLGYRLHGLTGALRLITKDASARVLDPEVEANRLMARDRELPTLSWFAPKQKLSIVPHRFAEAKLSELDFSKPEAGWQLSSGWFEREGNFRWAGRVARLNLGSKPGDRKLRVRYNNGPAFIKAVGQLEVAVIVNGELIGTSTFDRAGTPFVDYALPSNVAGRIEVELRSSPGFQPPGDDRELGVAVLSVQLIR